MRAVSGARLFQLDDGGLRELPMSLDRTSHGIFFWKKEVASPCDKIQSIVTLVSAADAAAECCLSTDQADQLFAVFSGYDGADTSIIL